MSTINGFLEGLSFIRSNIHSDMALQQLHLYLVVAKKEGVTMPELEKLLDMPQGTVSRNIKKLSKYVERYKGKDMLQGYDLVYTSPDIYDRRINAVYLTEKGRKVLADLEKVLIKEE